MNKAALLACGASLAVGLHVTTQRTAPAGADMALEAAIGRLEGMWPDKGREMLQEVFGSIPPHDHGAALRKKLLQRLRTRSAFVFAAFGSSVSAGHDNIMNQSWPFELERLLQPTFRELGFDFEVRQRAAGGYGEMPFAAGCLLGRAGEGVDALSWEWHMFYDSPCEGHHFLSEAAAMESSPVVFGFADSSIEFALGDGRDVQGCKEVRARSRREMLRNHDATLNLPRDWRPNEWYLTEEFASRAEADRLGQESGGCAEAGATRGAPDMTWLQRTGVAPAFESRGHAFYPVSMGAASKHVVGRRWYQAREKAFNINWHPGPLGHTLIASSIAHFILTNLKDALDEEDGSPDSRHQGPSLDNPLVGTPIIGHLEAPQCGSLRAQGCKTGLFPTTAGTGLDSARGRHSADTWEFAVSMQAAERSTEAVDKRWVYRGNKTSGELKLSFTADSDGTYVVLCGAPCGWSCAGGAGYVSSKSQRWWPKEKGQREDVSDLSFTVDGRAVDGARLLELHDELFRAGAGAFCPGCKNPADLCQPVAKVGAGRHTVGASVEPRSAGPGRADGEDVFVEIMELVLVG